jgi:hypothetical protein
MQPRLTSDRCCRDLRSRCASSCGWNPRPVARCSGSMRGLVVLAALLLASCSAGSVGETTPDRAISGSAVQPTDEDRTPSRAPTSATGCPVTLPNGHHPPGQTSRLSHGNGRLWVELYPRGVIRPAYYGRARPNGAIAVKFPWTRGVTGQLRISVRRLDGDGPALRSWVPNGYGRTGFQSTAIVFPTTGCWVVTGRVGGASLTFVTKVT